MEDGCEVATGDEVAAVVHQIFAYAAAGTWPLAASGDDVHWLHITVDAEI
jgi:hypothetical protein